MQTNRHVVFWLAASVTLILVLALLKDILLPFAAGVIIADFMDPFAERLVGAGLTRTLALASIVGTGGAIAVGMLVAVPVAVAVVVFVHFVLSLYMQSDVYRGNGALPGAGA